ncbi:hypothetical protein FDO65_19720 [Nakamurella flava]|uniref:Uncharacterized protein n=1 Tax=Nakamurella flava TaxID=2576308 RepID=A0A4U6QAQ5_9ACTN|nr:hypothetical protein [Nakamurella flava]TKV57043.1 hypothetical protein FDO65_19720 [Nakamurella flava]
MPPRYAQSWALFADWCAAAGRSALPADPATVLTFLQACPAAVPTQRRRVVAIDHHHVAAGQAPPGDDDDVRAAVGRPPGEPPWVAPDRAGVDAALRTLPSHGFTRGLFGRRDRALLVLAAVAGLPYRTIAGSTAADLHHEPGTGTVAVAIGRRRRVIVPVENALLCPACALTRWAETHAVLTRQIATRALAAHLRAVAPVTDTDDHHCRRPVSFAVGPVPLFPPIDQWGHVAFPQTPLSPHAVSRQTRTLLAGDVSEHRDVPVVTVEEQSVPPTAPEPAAPTYGRAERDEAWNRRRADLHRLSGVADELDEVERRAAELNRRVEELLGQLL